MRSDDNDFQGTETPRSGHHYVLAHYAFRILALSSSYAFFTKMAQDGKAFLEDIWAKVSEQCDDTGAPDFGMNDVKVVPTRIGKFPIMLILFPPPVRPAEVFMCVVVLKVSLDAPELPEEPEVDYYTLELGLDLETMRPRTVLCGWNKAGDHLNFGDGPDPDPDKFIEVVAKRLFPE
jgi:hypothetical protein